MCVYICGNFLLSHHWATSGIICYFILPAPLLVCLSFFLIVTLCLCLCLCLWVCHGMGVGAFSCWAIFLPEQEFCLHTLCSWLVMHPPRSYLGSENRKHIFSLVIKMPWLTQWLDTPKSSPATPGPVGEGASVHLPEISHDWLAYLLCYCVTFSPQVFWFSLLPTCIILSFLPRA